MKRLRRYLSFSIYPLFLLLLAAGFAFHCLARALMWLSMVVIRRHVVFPIVVLRRAIAGKPIWVPGDLLIGVYPEGKRARAAAAEAGLLEVPACACGNPECANAKVMTWVHKNELAAQREMQRLANKLMDQAGLSGLNVAISTRPPNPPEPPAA